MVSSLSPNSTPQQTPKGTNGVAFEEKDTLTDPPNAITQAVVAPNISTTPPPANSLVPEPYSPQVTRSGPTPPPHPDYLPVTPTQATAPKSSYGPMMITNQGVVMAAKGAPPPLPKLNGPPQVRPSIGSKAAGPPPPPVKAVPPRMSIVAPPPPPRMSMAPPASSSPTDARMNDFINIHWKPCATAAVSAGTEDAFLKPFILDTKSSVSVEKLLMLDPIPDVILGAGGTTVFGDDDGPVVNVPGECVKKFFQKKQSKIEIGDGSGKSMTTGGEKKTALDRERLKLIALAIGGSLGGMKSAASGNRRTVFRQYREAIVRCDFTVLTTDILCPLLQLLMNVTVEEMAAVNDAIRSETMKANQSSSISAILEQFEEPDVFLYEMSQIPEIKTRIECMIFEQTFEDLFQLAVTSLHVIYSALEVVRFQLGKIKRLFRLILKVGNTLNEGSKIGSLNSFTLSTLSKLGEVKSSIDPKVDLLHFILSLIAGDECQIFSESDCSKLKAGASLRCYRVRDEVKDLLDSVGAVREILTSPVPSGGEGDVFNDRMRLFSKRIEGTEQWLSLYALNVFTSYRNLSKFFQDTKSVYPPPKEKTNEQFDIIELFAWFSGVLKTHEKDVKKMKLRNRIAGGGGGSDRKSLGSSSPKNSTGVTSPSKKKHIFEPMLPAVIESPVQIPTIPPLVPPPATASPAAAAVSPLVSRRNPSAGTQEAIHASIKELASGDSLPIAAILNRTSENDLKASKPALSPIPVVLDAVVVKATPSAAPVGRRLLTTKTAASLTRPPGIQGLSVAVLPPQPVVPRVPSLDFSVSNQPVLKTDENSNFFADVSSYPVRREGLPDMDVVQNTRVSLSNTVSRVAMLLSPGRDDNSGIYKGARRNRPSFIGTSVNMSES